MNASVSPDWEVLLAPFQSLFSASGFRYFCVFARVLAHLDGRLWVTRPVLSGLLTRHWTNFYRFLRSPAWSPQAVARVLYRQCRDIAAQSGRGFLVVDDTICAKYGECFDALSTHHDPMNRQRPKPLSRGHCFVCLAVLAQQGAARWTALFVSRALYIQKKARGEGQTFATKLQLAVALLASLPAVANLMVVVVGDGAYAKQAFVQPVCASGKHVCSRLRRDSVFYDLPPARKPGQKGAPRKYGDKHKAAQWAAEPGEWQSVPLCLYGRAKPLALKSRVVMPRRLHVQARRVVMPRRLHVQAHRVVMPRRLHVQARRVAVQWKPDKIVFLFCTDTTMTAEQIVQAYCARFAIETGFRDAKQSLGLSTYQVRNQIGLVRLAHLCLWAQTLLRLRCHNQVPTEQYGGWRKRLDYLTLCQQKRLSRSTSRSACRALRILCYTLAVHLLHSQVANKARADLDNTAFRTPETLNYSYKTNHEQTTVKITVLGSGTSHGVPMIGCECGVCRSPNPKNKRFRSSIVVTAEASDAPSGEAQAAQTAPMQAGSVPADLTQGGAGKSGARHGEIGAGGRNIAYNILVDTTPELRMQALAFDLRRVDAVLLTHTHADHVMGMDDLRRFNDLHDVEIPVYGDPATLDDIRRIYPYIFRDTGQLGGGKPRLSLRAVEPEFHLFGLDIQSFYVMHGRLPVLAYRFDQPQTASLSACSFAYVTDVNHIPDEAMTKLHNLDLLILDAVRFDPHTTHFGFYEALDVIATLAPKQALLTHLSHHFDHDKANALAPANVALAYDGQVVSL